MSEFTCVDCGQPHPEIPAFHTAAPLVYDLLSPEEQERALLGSDQCVIESPEGTHYFVRGLLEVPVRGHPQHPFTWGVWVSLSEASFARMSELWETPGREAEPPYFGWLCTRLPLYPDTASLKTHVHTRPLGERPWIELEPTEHPLAVEQREGIDLERALALAAQLLG